MVGFVALRFGWLALFLLFERASSPRRSRRPARPNSARLREALRAGGRRSGRGAATFVDFRLALSGLRRRAGSFVGGALSTGPVTGRRRIQL